MCHLKTSFLMPKNFEMLFKCPSHQRYPSVITAIREADHRWINFQTQMTSLSGNTWWKKGNENPHRSLIIRNRSLIFRTRCRRFWALNIESLLERAIWIKWLQLIRWGQRVRCSQIRSLRVLINFIKSKLRILASTQAKNSRTTLSVAKNLSSAPKHSPTSTTKITSLNPEISKQSFKSFLITKLALKITTLLPWPRRS